MQDQAFTVIPGYSKEETADIYHELLSLLCTPMKIGTHYEGASTNDITFWVIHPAFDRWVCCESLLPHETLNGCSTTL